MSRLTRIFALLAANAAVFLVLEGSVRLAGSLGWLSLPAGGVQGFDQAQHGRAPAVERRLYMLDRDLLIRMRPDFEQTYPRLFVQRNGRETYQVRTNDRGFRTPPFTESKRPGVIRVVCLGDSSTFGMNVEEVDSYPRQLARLLEQDHPGRFEVLNLGVPGYTSRQGLELLRREVLALEPDVVTFAFGTNDRFPQRPITDDEAIRFNQSLLGTLLFEVRGGMDRLHVYRSLRALSRRVVQLDYDFVGGGGPRSTPEDIRNAVVAAHAALSPIGASLLVVDSDFFVTDAAESMYTGAQQAGARFVDLPGELREERRIRSRRFEAEHGLGRGMAPPGKAVFRVHAPGEQRVFLRLGPTFAIDQTLPMRDDGAGADQTAGDGVWSAVVDLHQGRSFYYSYWRGNPPDLEPEFRVNSFVVDLSRRAVVVPADSMIDEFGLGALMTDQTHPDEEGHAIIARRLAQEISALERVRAAL
jgi:lysophospholipase L1-like esterase